MTHSFNLLRKRKGKDFFSSPSDFSSMYSRLPSNFKSSCLSLSWDYSCVHPYTVARIHFLRPALIFFFLLTSTFHMLFSAVCKVSFHKMPVHLMNGISWMPRRSMSQSRKSAGRSLLPFNNLTPRNNDPFFFFQKRCVFF